MSSSRVWTSCRRTVTEVEPLLQWAVMNVGCFREKALQISAAGDRTQLV
ncbi:hypothetical protein [Halorhabdus salina]|nr:hypothetical protein [Halorhabdus salina]